jgi:hypothetical protein
MPVRSLTTTIGLSKLRVMVLQQTVRTWERGLVLETAADLEVGLGPVVPITESICTKSASNTTLTCMCAEGYFGDGTFCEARCPRSITGTTLTRCTNVRLRRWAMDGLATAEEEQDMYWGTRCEQQCTHALSSRNASTDLVVECTINGNWEDPVCLKTAFVACGSLTLPEVDVECLNENTSLSIVPGATELSADEVGLCHANWLDCICSYTCS